MYSTAYSVQRLFDGSIGVIADVSSSKVVDVQQAIQGGLLGFVYVNATGNDLFLKGSSKPVSLTIPPSGGSMIFREDRTFQVLQTGPAIPITTNTAAPATTPTTRGPTVYIAPTVPTSNTDGSSTDEVRSWI